MENPSTVLGHRNPEKLGPQTKTLDKSCTLHMMRYDSIIVILIKYCPRGACSMPKQKQAISISVDPQLLEWIDQGVKSHKFASRSHAIEYCIERTRRREGIRNSD